jgi:hypothetical protein
VSAVIVEDARDADVRQELLKLKQLLGRRPDDVIHFRNLTHSQKVKACQEISNFPIEGFGERNHLQEHAEQAFSG